MLEMCTINLKKTHNILPLMYYDMLSSEMTLSPGCVLIYRHAYIYITSLLQV